MQQLRIVPNSHGQDHPADAATLLDSRTDILAPPSDCTIPDAGALAWATPRLGGKERLWPGCFDGDDGERHRQEGQG